MPGAFPNYIYIVNILSQMKNQKIIKRVTHKGVFPYQFAFTLLIPLRNLFLSPKKLIKRLSLAPDAMVLEVGCGPGYFSVPVATHLTGGRLVLADIQQEMLDYAARRINKKGLTNCEYYLCDGAHFTQDDCSFDVIYMITVLGEIENKALYLKAFYRLLKPGGILSFSEQAGDPDKLSKAEIKSLLADTGFEFQQDFGNDRNFTINFVKPVNR